MRAWFCDYDAATLLQVFPFGSHAFLWACEDPPALRVPHNRNLLIVQEELLGCLSQGQSFFKQRRINELMAPRLEEFSLEELKEFDLLASEARSTLRVEEHYVCEFSSFLKEEAEGFVMRRMLASVMRLMAMHFHLARFASDQLVRRSQVMLSRQEWRRLNSLFQTLYRRVQQASGDFGYFMHDLCELGLHTCAHFEYFEEQGLADEFREQCKLVCSVLLEQNGRDRDRLTAFLQVFSKPDELTKLLSSKLDSPSVKSMLEEVRKADLKVEQREELPFVTNLRKHTIIVREMDSSSGSPRRTRPRKVESRLVIKDEEQEQKTISKNQIKFETFLKAIENQFKINEVDPVGLGFKVFGGKKLADPAAELKLLSERYDSALLRFNLDRDFSDEQSGNKSKQSSQWLDRFESSYSGTSEGVREKQKTTTSRPLFEINQVPVDLGEYPPEELGRDVFTVLQEEIERQRAKDPFPELKVGQLKWQMRGLWSIPILFTQNLITERRIYRLIRKGNAPSQAEL